MMSIQSVWIDVPSGYLFGFPKLYSPETDGELREWIKEQGYHDEPAWIRQWGHSGEV